MKRSSKQKGPTDSLHGRCTCLPAIPVMLGTALVLIGVGLWLPALETKKLVVSVSSYSIAEGIRNLFAAGHWPIGLLVLAFSVLFPLVKLCGLGYVWFARLEPDRRRRLVRSLDALGKWSMLDVFVVAILIGALNLGFPSGAEARSGTYVFGGAILLSMISTRIVAHDAGLVEDVRMVANRVRAGVSALVGIGALSLYVVGMERTLLHTAKWHFWDTEYSVLAGTLELYESAPVLAAAILILVALLPIGRILLGLLLLLASILGRGESLPARGVRWLATDRWSMADVFILAVLVVATKLSDALQTDYQDGLLYFTAGVLLAFLFARLAVVRSDAPGSAG